MYDVHMYDVYMHIHCIHMYKMITYMYMYIICMLHNVQVPDYLPEVNATEKTDDKVCSLTHTHTHVACTCT